MTTATKPVTADELLAMGDIGRCELVKGEIVRRSPAGAEHGDVAAELARRIGNFVRERKLGRIYAAETGFVIGRSPDTVRAPDVGFVRSERAPLRGRRGFVDGAPDLAVEVVSFNDLASDVIAKVEEWLSAGAVSVWVVDPRTRTIQIHRQGAQSLRYREGDELKDEPTLPGFTMRIADVFQNE